MEPPWLGRSRRRQPVREGGAEGVEVDPLGPVPDDLRHEPGHERGDGPGPLGLDGSDPPGLGLARVEADGVGDEPGPGGVTVSEAKALDEAAEMLESRQSARADDPAEPDADGADAPE